jgi:hypothetical protein
MHRGVVRIQLNDAPVGLLDGPPDAGVRQQIEPVGVSLLHRAHRGGGVRRGRPDPDGVEFEHAAAPEEQVPVTGKQLEAFVDE